MINDLLVSRFEEMTHKYYSLFVNGNWRWPDLKVITEFEFLIDDFIEMSELDPIDRVNLEKISISIADKIRLDKIIFFYSTFRYFRNNLLYNDNYEEWSRQIYQMNIQINIMRIQFRHKMALGSSEDAYYFSRGQEMIEAIDTFASREEKKEIDYTPILYVLLNYAQSMLEYIRYFEQSDYGMPDYENVVALSKKCIKALKKLCFNFEKIKSDLKNNIKLKMFIVAFVDEYNKVILGNNEVKIKKKIYDIKNSSIVPNNIWALRNIYDLDKEYFAEYFEKNSDEYDRRYNSLYEESKIMYLRDCIRFEKLRKTNRVGILKLPAIRNEVDISWFDINKYISGYSESATVEVTEGEIKKMQKYNDEVLRTKIANIIKNIDKHVVYRESMKAHGVYEIADMELPIINPSREKYYICIPVKSGVEISSKVNEAITYQVFRPFTYFGHKAIVVFISAKDVTEPFYNSVKRAKANLNFEIFVLAGKELAKVLKFNHQLD